MQRAQRWLKSHLALWTLWPKSVQPKSLLTQAPNGCAPLKTQSQEGHVQYSFFYVCITSLLIIATLCSRLSHLEVTATRGHLSLWGKPSNTTSEKDLKGGGKPLKTWESLGEQLLWIERKYGSRRKEQASQPTGSQSPEQTSGIKRFCYWDLSQRLRHTIFTLTQFAN